MNPPSPQPSRPGSIPVVLAWGAFLACSWTWCIGMFLPALLARDYGLWGFLVFAVPNVAGAAAMGWIIRDHADAFRARHSRAIRAFSVVTIAFQAYFLGWLARHSPIGPALVIVAAVLAILASRPLRPRSLALAAGVWIASMAIGVFAFSRGALQTPPVINGPPGLAWLAPVCVFGFLLCPYLDATFHRARAELPRSAARAAFTLGFGLMFLAMILLTLGYGANLSTLENALGGSGAASRAIQMHIALQLGFTIGVHARDSRWIPARHQRGALAAGLLALAMLAFGRFADWPAPWTPPRGRLGAGEVMYRAFMGFYGLAFPAYVWLVVIASPSGASGPSRARMRVWAAAVGLATPMFWKGFVDRREAWLIPGLLIVLAARAALPRREE